MTTITQHQGTGRRTTPFVKRILTTLYFLTVLLTCLYMSNLCNKSSILHEDNWTPQRILYRNQGPASSGILGQASGNYSLSTPFNWKKMFYCALSNIVANKPYNKGSSKWLLFPVCYNQANVLCTLMNKWFSINRFHHKRKVQCNSNYHLCIQELC